MASTSHVESCGHAEHALLPLGTSKAPSSRRPTPLSSSYSLRVRALVECFSSKQVAFHSRRKASSYTFGRSTCCPRDSTGQSVRHPPRSLTHPYLQLRGFFRGCLCRHHSTPLRLLSYDRAIGGREGASAERGRPRWRLYTRKHYTNQAQQFYRATKIHKQPGMSACAGVTDKWAGATSWEDACYWARNPVTQTPTHCG